MSARMKARILATAGEALRLTGDQRQAGRYLKEAVQIQLEHRYFGLLADFTYASLAKWERTWPPVPAVAGQGHQHPDAATGITSDIRTRSCWKRDSATARTGWKPPEQTILTHREALPALAECPLLGRILEHWEKWVGREKLTDEDDEFWGL